MTQEKSRLVSVILPAYNVSDYLDACLESITSQTYINTEIIIVDDGSTDDTPRRADDWLSKDERVHVIHQKNGGLSAARNAGLHYAHGDFILFVDPDDCIDENLISKCMTLLSNGSVSLVHFGYRLIDENGLLRGRNFPDRLTNAEKLLPAILSDKIPSHSWQFLCKKELYSDIVFPEGRKAEDVATTYKLVAKAKKCAILPDCLYKYRVRSNSILGELASDNFKAIKYYEDELLAFHEMIDWAVIQEQDDYQNLAWNNELMHLFNHYKERIAVDDNLGIKWVHDKIYKELSDFVPDRMTPLNRFKAFLFRFRLIAFYYHVMGRLKKRVKCILRKE